MERKDLSNKTREELIVINSNAEKVICTLSIMLMVFMILTAVLLFIR